MAQQLSAEFPKLKTFATLSPIPGFRRWLDGMMAEGRPNLLSSAERKALNEACGRKGGAKGSLMEALKRGGWCADPAVCEALKGPLMRLAAQYLTQEKRKDGQRALDPVAHFHLSNGAVMERLNWLGDTSSNGFAQSAGMMINYLYDLGRIEGNHEAYTSTGAVAMSSSMKGLLKT